MRVGLQRNELWLTLAALSVMALWLVVPSLVGGGIWDPPELERAELARRIAVQVFGADELRVADAPNELPTLGDLRSGELGYTSMAWGMSQWGLRPWAGRLPLALWCVAGALALFVLLARLVRPRAGLYAVIVLCTMPLYFMQARTMLGDAAAMGAFSLAVCGLAGALLDRDQLVSAAFAAIAVVGLVGGYLSRGALLGVAAPCLGVGVAWLTFASRDGGARPRVVAVASLAVGAVSVYLGSAAVLAGWGETVVTRHAGVALLQAPPREATFDLFVRELGHGLFPWSALAPFALAHLLFAQPERPRRSRLGSVLGVTTTLAFAAHAWLAPYTGALPFIAPAALAAMVALMLDDLDRRATPSPAIAGGVLLLGTLLLADLRNTPDKLLVAFGVAASAPADLHGDGLTLAGGLFLLLAAVTFLPGPQHADDSVASWLRRRIEHYETAARSLSAVYDGNLVFGFLVIEAAAAGLGAMLLLGRWRGWASVAHMPQWFVRIGLNAWWVMPLALVLVPIGIDLGRLLVGAPGRRRGAPRVLGLLVAALVGGGISSFVTYPSVVHALSPKAALERYAALHRPGERLAVSGVSRRIGHYYTEGEVETAAGPRAARSWLVSGVAADPPERRWLVFRAEDLPELNALFRASQGVNLPVVEGSGEVMLASSWLGDQADDNPLSPFVLAKPPSDLQHPTKARFGGELDVIGWEIIDEDGQPARVVVPGHAYRLRFVYRVLAPLGRNYTAFIHLDGYGRRYNGDHEVVGGRYPMTRWRAGDVIVDEHEMELSARFPPGDYELLFGFFTGRDRVPVTRGLHRQDRVVAGTIVVK